TTASGKLWFTDNSGLSEEQELTINATENLGGTYKLSFEGQETGATGSGNLLSGAKGKGTIKRWPTTVTNATCTRKTGSNELTGCNSEPAGKAEPGMRIAGTGIPLETLITKVEGTTITMSKPASSGGTGTSTTNINAGRVLVSETTSGKFEPGQTVSGTGITTGSIISVEEKEGKVVAVAVAGTSTSAGITSASGTATEPSATTTTAITAVTTSTGAFSIGETVSGKGIPAGTTITAINTNLKTLTLSATPTEAGTGVSLSADLAYSASGQTIKAALEKLSTIGANNVNGGVLAETTPPIQRKIRFEAGRGNADVPQLECNGAGLTGTSPTCTVTTIQQGVANAIGCMTTSGKACGKETRWSLAGLYKGAFGITAGSDGNLWAVAGGFGAGTEIGKFGIECVENCSEPEPPTNKRTVTLTKSPAGNAGGGIGSVSSKPKGIKCATTCNEAVGRFYKNQSILLTEAPSGELSKFKEWKGEVCNGSTATTCTIPADSNDYKVEAVFEGSSKAFSPAEALTLSKGESEDNRGYGTVKASGLTCESECKETTVLYQGPILSPKFKAGKMVELKEAPAFGSKFVGWSGACSGSEPVCKVTMEEAESVTAEFAPVPNKVLTVEKKYEGGLGTVSSKPKGITCGSTCTSASANMPEGSSILLTAKVATTEPPTTFVEWKGGDCEGLKTTTCTVGMDKAETVKAVFSGPVKAINSPKALTLTKDAEGTGFGTVKASGMACEALCTSATSLYAGPVLSPKFKAGYKVILKATSAPGSKTVEWTGCDSNPTASECIVVMESDKAITAKFDELK
ncbi:MAG TPA: hypothetical protein VHL50_11600, partial [Pyrinomonadaceae bacterium]|nr:hypothetical protein [Pyrinomonadaceae bacterium]